MVEPKLPKPRCGKRIRRGLRTLAEDYENSLWAPVRSAQRAEARLAVTWIKRLLVYKGESNGKAN